MNRVVIGVALLAALLAASLFSAWQMGNIQQPIADRMEEASLQSLRGESAAAAETAARAESAWHRSRVFTAALADHQPMEDIEGLFARLHAYETEDRSEYAALCAEIARRIRAVAEAQELSLGSFF